MKSIYVIILCFALTQYVIAAPFQHEHHRPTSAVPKNGDTSPPQDKAYIKPAIPDSEVFDQNGKRLRFYTDLIKGKVVVINFIFTSCGYICPMQGTSFSNLQTALGERLGRDTHLISVSTDPLVDTPQKLKEWGDRFGAKPGWTLVTGEKKQMDKLLLALTGDTARIGEHSPIAVIGKDDKGIWIRAYGLESPQRIIEIIGSIANSTGAEVSNK